MKHLLPKVKITDKVAVFTFTLMDRQLTSTQVLELLEETATRSDESWAYRKDGDTVETMKPNDNKFYLLATPFELLYHSPDPKRIFEWMPFITVRYLATIGQTIPVILDGKETTYTSLVSVNVPGNI